MSYQHVSRLCIKMALLGLGKIPVACKFHNCFARSCYLHLCNSETIAICSLHCLILLAGPTFEAHSSPKSTGPVHDQDQDRQFGQQQYNAQREPAASDRQHSGPQQHSPRSQQQHGFAPSHHHSRGGQQQPHSPARQDSPRGFTYLSRSEASETHHSPSNQFSDDGRRFSPRQYQQPEQQPYRSQQQGSEASFQHYLPSPPQARQQNQFDTNTGRIQQHTQPERYLQSEEPYRYGRQDSDRHRYADQEQQQQQQQQQQPQQQSHRAQHGGTSRPQLQGSNNGGLSVNAQSRRQVYDSMTTTGRSSGAPNQQRPFERERTQQRHQQHLSQRPHGPTGALF